MHYETHIKRLLNYVVFHDRENKHDFVKANSWMAK